MSGLQDGIENTFGDKDIGDSQLDVDLEIDVGGYQAVVWYGILAIVHATWALLWYMLGNNDRVIRGYYQIMIAAQVGYWPVAIGWAMIALFDSDFSRDFFKAALSISTLVPFAGNIIGFVYIWINADASAAWNDWWFWLLWPLFLCYDVGQMLLAYMFVPTALDFVNSANLQTA